MNGKTIGIGLTFLALLLAAGGASGAGPYYVAMNGDGSDGSTWAKAFTNVQTALNAAKSNDTIYLKGETFNLPVNSANGKLVWTQSWVTVLGGYAADGGTPGATTNTPTILNNTDSANLGSNRVLWVSNVINGTLKGVTIQGGQIGWPTAQKGTIWTVEWDGGGVYMTGSTNMLFDTVTLNANFIGGQQSCNAFGFGMYATGSYGVLTNCVIKNSTAFGLWSPQYGGGLHIAGGGWLLRDCLIRDNRQIVNSSYTCTPYGMGLYVNGGTHAIRNCIFSRNHAYSSIGQGEGIYVAAGNVSVENATMYFHPHEGIRLAGGSLTVTNSILWGNGTYDIVGLATNYVTCCDIGVGDRAFILGGNFSANPLFERGLYLATNSPCVNTGSKTAATAGLAGYTTRADGTPDSGTVDLGYHFKSGSTDLYVSVNSGSDANAGTGPGAGNAFKTIGKAIAVAGDGTRINIEAGIYATNTETFPLTVANNYGLQLLGTNSTATLINAKGAGASARVMTFSYEYPNAVLGGLTLANANWTAYTANWGGARYGGGLYIEHSQGAVQSCAVTNNTINPGGNPGVPRGIGIYATLSDIVVSNCLVKGNIGQAYTYETGSAGGGIAADGTLSFLIVNSTIASNVVKFGDASYSAHSVYGGGLYLNGTGVVRNCLIVGNDADRGGNTGNTAYGDGVYVAGGGVVMENCTVVTNIGIGIQQAGGTFAVTNSIVWYNGDDVSGAVSLAYCDIQNGDNAGVNGCISNNPAFSAGYRLSLPSPCLNTGTNLSWMQTGFDLDGNSRIRNVIADMGAYETFVPLAITNLPPAPVDTMNVVLRGKMLSDGEAQPANVWVFWGPTDAGKTNAGWANTNAFGACQQMVVLSTNAFVAKASTNYYRFYVSNTLTEAWSDPAMSFQPYPPLPPVITNDVSGATNMAATSAWLNGDLLSTGGVPTYVWVSWDTVDRTTNKIWAGSYDFGGGAPSTGYLTYQATNLTQNTWYWYTYYASNVSADVWAQPSTRFKTLGAPGVNNANSATNLKYTAAVLNGTLTNGGSANISIYWWAAASSVTNVLTFPVPVFEGVFSTNLTGLSPATTYYYQCFASNVYGWAWADAATNFTTLSTIYYVAQAGGSAPYDGTSWAHALTNVQDALNGFAGATIYVKGETFNLPVNSANGRLVWTNSGVQIFGGYAADGGSPGALTNTPTVLTVNTNTTYLFETNRILYVSGVTNGSLANVTIKGGMADYYTDRDTFTGRNGYGAGMYVTAATNLLFSSVIFDGNFIATRRNAQSFGGGAYVANSWGSFSNCIFRDNTIGDNYPDYPMYLVGAGLCLSSGGWTVRDCVFRENRIVNQYGFNNNAQGIGMYATGGVHTVQNCAFTQNIRQDGSSVQGDGLYVAGGTVTVQNCTFYWHQFEGIRLAGGTVTARDSILWNNGTYDIVGVATNYVASCDIGAGDRAFTLGGNISANPLYERGLYLAAGSPCIDTGSQLASAAGLAGYTTRADGTPEGATTVDMGYHFAPGAALPVDLYVSVNSGSDANNGTSAGTPFRSITKALSVVQNGGHVLVQAGIYTTNTETFPLTLSRKWGVQLLGTNRDTTVLNAKGAGARVLGITFDYPVARIEGLTLCNASWSGAPQSGGGGLGGAGGGLYLSDVQGTIASCAITNNALTDPGGWGVPFGAGIYATVNDILMTNCVVRGNTATSWYPENCGVGGIYADAMTMVNCFIDQNSGNTSGNGSWHPTTSGGGLYLSNARLRNCLISRNAANGTAYTSKLGDGVYVSGGNVVIESCTIVTNVGAAGAWNGVTSQGIYRPAGTVAVTNSIVWNNGVDVTGVVALAYSDVGVCDPAATTNACISADPRFKSATSNDYSLQLTSSCINKGSNQSWMNGATDLSGGPRIQNRYVDMGAYETLLPSGGTAILFR